MERMTFIIGLLGTIFGALLLLVHTGLTHRGINASNVEGDVAVVIFFVGLALDLLGIILGISAWVREGRSKEAIGGIVGGLVGLMLLGLAIFVIVAGFLTPR